MKCFKDVIEEWDNPNDLAKDIGVKVGTIAVWKFRNNIPPNYWLALVNAAKRAGIEGVTLHRLAQIAATTGKTSGQKMSA